MRIHHIAIWTFRLEEMKEFYIRYFKGTGNEKYVNPQKDLNLTLSVSTAEPTWS